jgi:hypothetical protein
MIVALAAEKSAVTQAATILQYGNKIVVDGDDSRIDVSRALITSKELNDEILLIDEIRFVGWTPERYSPEKRFHLTFQSIEPLESGRHYWQDLSFARVGVFGEIGPLEDSEFPVTSNLNLPVGAGFEVRVLSVPVKNFSSWGGSVVGQRLAGEVREARVSRYVQGSHAPGFNAASDA